MTIRGIVNRLAVHTSLQRTLISSPRELFERARSNVRGIVSSFTCNVEYEEETKYLNSERYTGLRTRSIHCVFPVN